MKLIFGMQPYFDPHSLNRVYIQADLPRVTFAIKHPVYLSVTDDSSVLL